MYDLNLISHLAFMSSIAALRDKYNNLEYHDENGNIK